jgi:hypothetical protein
MGAVLLATVWLAAVCPAQSDGAAARATRFLAGRGQTPAKALDAARRAHAAMLVAPRDTSLTAAWTAVGPGAVVSARFGNLSGRVTAITIDPADATGNTLYVGTTGGGVWKSTNAAGAAAAVAFAPLTDTLSVFSGGQTIPSLSIGALALGGGVLLAGTGDPNDATDSYYGSGILRSPDGGATWTLAQSSEDGVSGNHTFIGLGVAGIAFSTANPSLVVAGMSQAVEGTIVNAADATFAVPGLYYSSDAGVTWHMATIEDGSMVVQGPASSAASNAATAVVWNPVRRGFVAAVRGHGYYGSADGRTWRRLPTQPGAGLTVAACPTTGAASCPISRGALAVDSFTGDTFALTVDAANRDQGLYRDICAQSGGSCAGGLAFGTQLNATAMETPGGVIAQADYNLTLAASAVGADTILFAGTSDLYRCSLATGCQLRNTTNAANGCATPAHVAGADHALAAVGTLLFVGTDGGLWRSTDAVNQQAVPCSQDDANHFQNLNAGIGSLAEVVSFAQDSQSATTLLAGLGALGTAGTSTVTNSWPQLSAGEGGTVAIDQMNPQNWYLSTGAGVSVGRCSRGAGCTPADFRTTAIGLMQTANDPAEVHAPWLLDPGLSANLIAGTCRLWRGPATGGVLWTTSNAISAPLAAPLATSCQAGSAFVRSLAAGGAAVSSGNPQNSGSPAIYAGLAGTLDGGAGLGGHLFATTAANLATSMTAWLDLHLPNPGGFDVSSVAVDTHDATGATVYATVMGFAGTGVNAGHIYRSLDGGAHWTNVSSNLPNAPANSVVIDPNDANTLYVALDTGVYVTTQVTTCASANCWTPYGTALPNSPVISLEAGAVLATGDGRLGELRAATYGRGIWQIPLLTAAAPNLPSIALSPTSVTYPLQQVGTLGTSVLVTVTNTGKAALIVSRISVTGDFASTDTCVGGAIVQQATCAVQVSFVPTAIGNRSGLLTIYGNVAGGQATAVLAGVGSAPASIVLTPMLLSFPATTVGATSMSQIVTISNTGGTPATLQTPVITGDFGITSNTCGSSLGAGTGCSLVITFKPMVAGARTGNLTVTDSVGMQVVTLSGVGTTPPTDSLSSMSLTFPAQQLNTSSLSQQIMLSNAGDAALTLIQPQISSGPFSVLNGCGNSLSAHSSCALPVTFTPNSVGPQTGVLTIADQFRSQTVALLGTGVAPPGVSLSPATGLTFGLVGVGLTSPAQAITLTNHGGIVLGISNIVATGDFALLVGGNTCGSSLAPATACTVTLALSPSIAGPRTGMVTFTDAAANSPQTLALTGTGVDFSLAVNGAASATLKSGGTAPYLLALSSAPGVTGDVGFTCSGVPVHASCTVNPATTALGGTQPITVTVATGLLTGAVEAPQMPWSGRLVWLAVLLPAGLLARRRRFAGLAALVIASVLGCSATRLFPGDGGSGATVAPTPSGTYTLVVAGSSAGLVRAVNLTVVVQ